MPTSAEMLELHRKKSSGSSFVNSSSSNAPKAFPSSCSVRNYAAALLQQRPLCRNRSGRNARYVDRPITAANVSEHFAKAVSACSVRIMNGHRSSRCPGYPPLFVAGASKPRYNRHMQRHNIGNIFSYLLPDASASTGDDIDAACPQRKKARPLCSPPAFSAIRVVQSPLVLNNFCNTHIFIVTAQG